MFRKKLDPYLPWLYLVSTNTDLYSPTFGNDMVWERRDLTEDESLERKVYRARIECAPVFPAYGEESHQDAHKAYQRWIDSLPMPSPFDRY